MLADLVSMCEATLPREHYLTAVFRNNWGDVLIDLKDYPRAEAMLTASQPIIEKTFKPEHPRSVKGRNRLARLYQAWGKPDKVESSRQGS